MKMDFSVSFFNQQSLANSADNKQLSWEDNYFGCWSCDNFFETKEALQLHNKACYSTPESQLKSPPKKPITKRNITYAPYKNRNRDTPIDQQFAKLTINKPTKKPIDETTALIYNLDKLASKITGNI
jgi:hypothetical protein